MTCPCKVKKIQQHENFGGSTTGTGSTSYGYYQQSQVGTGSNLGQSGIDVNHVTPGIIMSPVSPGVTNPSYTKQIFERPRFTTPYDRDQYYVVLQANIKYIIKNFDPAIANSLLNVLPQNDPFSGLKIPTNLLEPVLIDINNILKTNRTWSLDRYGEYFLDDKFYARVTYNTPTGEVTYDKFIVPSKLPMPLGNVTLSIPTNNNNVFSSSKSDDNVTFNELNPELLSKYKKTYKKVLDDISEIDARNDFLTQENFTQKNTRKNSYSLSLLFLFVIFTALFFSSSIIL